jgi:pentatricopeptide repeat protein
MRGMPLDLGLFGNGTIAMLVDAHARVVWGCLPHPAGDPVFAALLEPRAEGGYLETTVDGDRPVSQRYLGHTPILVTTVADADGAEVEITDFAPRFQRFDRLYHPVMWIRRLRPLRGRPRVTIRARPLSRWGEGRPMRTGGSNHLRWIFDDFTLRLTTDVPVAVIEHELPFTLDREVWLVFGPDETLTDGVDAFAGDALRRTERHWLAWTRALSIPLEWQEAVLRAAITLKLCQYEGTGAILAAVTTSVPEAPGTARNWDYRFCWLRDAAFVVRALNQLGATASMEQFLHYIYTVAAGGSDLQPVYGIHFERELTEREVPTLAGYQGMGPVRAGNDAWRQRQHDVYGSVILASTHLFFDQRLAPSATATFEALETLGQAAYRLHQEPDAGLWEFRDRSGVHTYSSVMCWAACDRLARIAAAIGRGGSGARWAGRASEIRTRVLERAFDPARGAFMETWGGDRLDASALVLPELGFLPADDPRFLSTLAAIEGTLRRGRHVFRYVDPDDFGAPSTAFNLATFWYINALAQVGRRAEARELFEEMLRRRTSLGLLSEDLDPETGQLWGNVPQTYSLVGLIQCAVRLSASWETAS